MTPSLGRVVVLQSANAAHHPRHHHRLAKALQTAGYDVCTLAQPDTAGRQPDAVPVAYLPVRRSRSARMLSGPLSVVRALRLRPTVLYVVCLDLLPWTVLAHWLGLCRVVYDSNDDYESFILSKTWLPGWLRGHVSVLVGRFEPWLAARLDGATTALPTTQAKFERAGVRSVLVRNLPPAELLVSGTHRPPDVDVLVGGSFEPDQMDLLVRAAIELDRCGGKAHSWLIAARSALPDDRAALEAVLAEHSLENRFELHFDVPFSQMPFLMSRARVGLILYGASPAYAPRLPMRIFEYMAAGLPFVATETPGSASVIDTEVALTAAAGDPRAYAVALNELLEDPERRRRMSARGPELGRDLYNWEREAQKLTTLFEQVIRR